ncbi:MAG: 4a-hydroxytetrahydrobiopterin dehydratase [Vicingaceae bacterium]
MQDWIEENNKLKRSFKFNDFVEAWEFMSQVAQIAEEMEHHPTWTNTYNQVDIQLSTHDAGDKVTEKDRNLAQKINELLP